MARPILPEMREIENLKQIINEEVNKILIEVLDNPIKTTYKEIKKKRFGISITTYRFRTNSGNSYDLEFGEGIYNDGDIEIYGNSNLNIKSSTHISFTTTNRIKDKEYNKYNELTYNNEQFELFSRLSYLILEYVKSHPNVEAYTMNTHSDYKKSNIYDALYNNIFKKDFDKYLGNSEYYDGEDAEYYIKRITQ